MRRIRHRRGRRHRSGDVRGVTASSCPPTLESVRRPVRPCGAERWRVWRAAGSPKRIVVIEFDDVASATAWHGSAAYAPARAMRDASARSRMIVVEGV